MKKLPFVSSAMIAMLATGCGGGSSSSSGSSAPPAVVLPSPAPTPAPTPTPTPTPAPTPAPISYTPFDQINTDTLLLTAVTYSQMYSYIGQDRRDDHFLSSWGTAFGGTFTAATQGFRFDFFPTPWLPSDIVPSPPDQIKYVSPSTTDPQIREPELQRALIFFLPRIGSTRLNYVRPFRRVESARLGSQRLPLFMYGITGVPTTAADTFAGTLNYRLQINGTVDFDAFDLSGSTGVASINPATGVMSVQLSLVGTPRGGGANLALGNAQGSASVEAFNIGFRNGTWSSPVQTSTRGTYGFRGTFFGPRGRELGGAFSIQLSNGRYAWGAFSGLQD